MLKTIEISDVRLGMFIHKLKGSWLDHPFWKSRFLLVDPKTLSQLRESAVSSVVIDLSRGEDVSRRPGEKVPADVPARQKLSPASETPVDKLRRIRREFEPEARPKASVRKVSSQNCAARPRSMSAAPAVREFGNATALAQRSQRIISEAFLAARLGRKVNVTDVQPVVEDIFASVERNSYAFSGLMRCKQDHEFIYRRALSVSALMISLARRMQLSLHEVRKAGLAGLLMDIGACELPSGMVKSEDDFLGLDPIEWESHVLLGHHRLVSADGIPESVLRVCLRHHELLDGTGYPQGLAGREIDELSMMAAICDTFDLLVTTGVDGGAVDPARALAILSERPEKYDAEIVSQFIAAVGVYPVGAFVRLRSRKLGMVIDPEGGNGTDPQVLCFEEPSGETALTCGAVAIASEDGEDAIEGIANLAETLAPQDYAQLRADLFAQAATSF